LNDEEAVRRQNFISEAELTEAKTKRDEGLEEWIRIMDEYSWTQEVKDKEFMKFNCDNLKGMTGRKL